MPKIENTLTLNDNATKPLKNIKNEVDNLSRSFSNAEERLRKVQVASNIFGKHLGGLGNEFEKGCMYGAASGLMGSAGTGNPATVAIATIASAISGGIVNSGEYIQQNQNEIGFSLNQIWDFYKDSFKIGYNSWINSGKYDESIALSTRISKAAEAGYLENEDQELKLQGQLLGPGRKHYKNLQLNNIRKKQQKIRDEYGVTESQMIAYRLEQIPLSEPTTSFKFLQQERAGFSFGDTNTGQTGSDSTQSNELRSQTSNCSLFSQAGTGLMRGAGAVQQIAYSGLSDADIWDLDPLTGKVDDFQKTTTDALKTVQGDLDLVNLNGWSLMSDNISDTSIKFNTEFVSSSDSALSTVSTGLTAVNTGYGAVNTAATSLFNQTGTGFGNSLVAAQNYQENGLNMLGLTLGNQLPASLGIFQTSHETTFTKMGLAAHDFFDDVGFQASQVLGGLVTGEINSLDEAWSLFRLFPRHHLFDVIHRCH